MVTPPQERVNYPTNGHHRESRPPSSPAASASEPGVRTVRWRRLRIHFEGRQTALGGKPRGDAGAGGPGVEHGVPAGVLSAAGQARPTAHRESYPLPSAPVRAGDPILQKCGRIGAYSEVALQSLYESAGISRPPVKKWMCVRTIKAFRRAARRDSASVKTEPVDSGRAAHRWLAVSKIAHLS